MPSVKTVPIKDDDDNVVAVKFGPSKTFTDSLDRNYVQMSNAEGHTIRANRKIQQHYADKGYELAGKTPRKQEAA